MAVTALTVSVGHVIPSARSETEVLLLVGSIVIFTIAGVLIGGQTGPLIAARIPQKVLEKSLAVLFFLVALLMVGETILRWC